MGLTISRSKGESVIIKTSDGDIEVQSLTNQTRLNIIAPTSVKIWRRELLDDDLKLLPRDKSRGAKGAEQEEQGVRIQGYHTVPIRADQTPVEIQSSWEGMADVEKMSKCRDARLKKEEGKYYVTLWCYTKNMACKGVCGDWSDKRHETST